VRARIHSALSLALVLVATSAHAGSGINLRWNACLGDGGTQNRDFACDTNSGTDMLVCSFELSADIPEATGLEIAITLVAGAPVLPAWWSFKNVGSCRMNSLGFNTSISPLATSCVDWASGQATGGIAAYNIGIGSFGPNSARIIAALAVPASFGDLIAGQEYFSANITINHAKTVGTGACSGCTVPMCIVFGSQKVTTPVAANDRILTGATNGVDSYYATWQGGYSIPIGGADKSCPYPVPTRRTSWGAVKTLYR
jgi:hypothetical protein